MLTTVGSTRPRCAPNTRTDTPDQGVSTQRARRHPTARPVEELAGTLHELSGTSIDVPLLSRAVTHRSYAYEKGQGSAVLPHNERQELLGDSVLGLVVTDELYRRHPDLTEGQLTPIKASIVNARACAQVARSIGLGAYVLLGKGELGSGGRDKDSILADAMEAIIGTVYLCGGLPAAQRFILATFGDLFEGSLELGPGLDWKTSLQELCVAFDVPAPRYLVTEEGPDHDKVFTATVVVGEETFGSGVGRNKKTAEQKVAEIAWREMSQRPVPDLPRA